MKTTLLIALAMFVAAASGVLAGDQDQGKAKKDTKATASLTNASVQKQPTKEGQKVLLTGSHIKQKIRRNNRITDGAHPVTVLDRTTIDQSGAATLKDLLRRENFR